MRSPMNASAAASGPLALIAELTHRCPLHCVYCSNPKEFTRRERELPASAWARVLGQAAEMGVLQADFTGGEPLARPDLVEIIRAARGAGLYASLITSGLPLDEKRLEEIVGAGLDHLQLSFQGAEEESASEFSGTQSACAKIARRGMGEAASDRADAEFRGASREFGSTGRDDCAGGADWAAARGICARSILWMGICESREAAADARAVG